MKNKLVKNSHLSTVTKHVPRGLRNKNPLNIRKSEKIRWLGTPAQQPDRSFVTFKSMAYGYRAAWKLLGNYKLRLLKEGKPYTVRHILNRWAPPTENDTEAYIRFVCQHAGLEPDSPVPHPVLDKPQDTYLMRIIEAMTAMECGIPLEQVDRQAIVDGWKLMRSR